MFLYALVLKCDASITFVLQCETNEYRLPVILSIGRVILPSITFRFTQRRTLRYGTGSNDRGHL
jgi:hypothetical protein